MVFGFGKTAKLRKRLRKEIQGKLDSLSDAINKTSHHSRSIGDADDIFGSLTIAGKNPEFEKDGTEVTLEKSKSSVEMEIVRGDIKDIDIDGNSVEDVAVEIFSFLNTRIQQEGRDPFKDMKKTGESPEMPIPRELRSIFDKFDK